MFTYLTSLLTFVLTYLLPYLSTSLRIGPFHFQAGGRKRRSNLALVFMFILCYSTFCYGCMFAFVVIGLSQEDGWEERIRNNLFCVGWDVKLNQSSRYGKHESNCSCIQTVVCLTLPMK